MSEVFSSAWSPYSVITCEELTHVDSERVLKNWSHRRVRVLGKIVSRDFARGKITLKSLGETDIRGREVTSKVSLDYNLVVDLARDKLLEGNVVQVFGELFPGPEVQVHVVRVLERADIRYCRKFHRIHSELSLKYPNIKKGDSNSGFANSADSSFENSLLEKVQQNESVDIFTDL